ncbi:MAG: DEAD/DEAH box helicase [Chitinophagaceae bacterium]|nr:DEAD/DEAH box helicase [Chitinophagaceae bacterium]
MSLSNIIKYIYSHGSDEVIRRGKRIFLTHGAKLLRKDEFTGQLIFKVRNDQYHNHYNVSISRYQDERTITARCQCPYNMGEICRHEAAALFQLNDLINNQALDASQAHFNQAHTMVRMKSIDLKLLRLFTSNTLFEEAEKITQFSKARILRSENEQVEASIDEGGTQYQIRIKRNDDKSYDTSCTCDESRHPLCKHKTAVFLQILNSHGPFFFDTIRNWESQKNKLLGLYGYSLSDNLEGKFDFYYQDGKPFLKVLDTSIKKINTGGLMPERNIATLAPPKVISTADYTRRLGIVINLQETEYPFFSIDLVHGEPEQDSNQFVGLITKVDTSKYVDPELYLPEDRELIMLTRKVQKIEIAKYIARHSPFGDLWENMIHSNTEWNPETKELLYDYIHPRLLRLLNALGSKNPLYILPKNKAYKTSSLLPIKYIHHNIYPSLTIRKQKDGIKLDIHFNADELNFSIDENRLNNSILYLVEDQLFLANKAHDASRMNTLQTYRFITSDNWPTFLEQQLLPLNKLYEVDYDDDLIEHKKNSIPKLTAYLSEQGSYFIIKPMFDYDEVKVEWNNDVTLSVNDNGKVIIIQRNKEVEQNFTNLLQSLHTNLRKPEVENHFAIHSKYALQKNWFFLFFERMIAENVELFGYDQLRNLKVNKAKPNTRLFVSSNLDWFDTEIEIDFDGQSASLQDIQKALAIKQNYVPLKDGTLGLLPEEWLQKFSLLFKMSDASGNKLRVSKFNFNVIDELYDMIDDELIKEELDDKKRKLLNIDPEKFSDIPVPEQLQAELRPYQKAGFQWLAHLDQIKWGGLLADDMGLGKTIQTLTFLQHFKNQYEGLHALIICPTTLLFNWENEIKKFTPELTYLIHHGPGRTSKKENLYGYNLIISTYGTLRSDVSMLIGIDFDYIILDESQTIKNPISKVAKAAQLIPARNRIALSGTPMQNNTFDLFAQMNFLNPGMLGNKEFFREQFAKPVDKLQDEESKGHLRKLIYPFLLRRTKEQVAKDLPERTEITIRCEMGPEQKAIYESYRNLYRSKILGTIETQGIDKSQFTILQGLMKLRQICDSPAILNDEVKQANHSVKLDELVRELQENLSDHKVLIFSQFLGMLALIREKLKENDIPHQYFDGSYTARQREDAIHDFQNNDSCRAFLISLKAGGMGLNLTAADYVYIVDPWWNPAVEQQAIDRTHRIGQTKNIFAYRLICKDTVEEKIMTLKERKTVLVKDIISDDAQMIKHLSKEDIQYLFS